MAKVKQQTTKKTTAPKKPIDKTTNNKKETVEVVVSKMEKEAFLEGLVINNKATKPVSLLNDKLRIIFKTLTADEQLEVEKYIATLKTSATYTIHKYATYLLAQSIQQYNEEQVWQMKLDDRIKFVEALPAAIIDKLMKEQQYFSRQVQAVIDPESVEEVFFEGAST